MINSIFPFYNKEYKNEIVNIDALVKSPKTPSPLTGEGWGEGEKGFISNVYIPLPLIPSHPEAGRSLVDPTEGSLRQGRGNKTFYDCININNPKKNMD